eukprot:407242-Amphidinium_carterae.1
MHALSADVIDSSYLRGKGFVYGRRFLLSEAGLFRRGLALVQGFVSCMDPKGNVRYFMDVHSLAGPNSCKKEEFFTNSKWGSG